MRWDRFETVEGGEPRSQRWIRTAAVVAAAIAALLAVLSSHGL